MVDIFEKISNKSDDFLLKTALDKNLSYYISKEEVKDEIKEEVLINFNFPYFCIEKDNKKIL